MDLKQYLSEDLVCLNLEGRRREPIFREMVNQLASGDYLDEPEEAIQRLLEREKLASTGMKSGFAIPHAYLDTVARTLLMVGISRPGIDFQTLEHTPIHIVFLLLGPPSQKTQHVRILARLSRAMSAKNLADEILTMKAPREVIEAMAQAAG